MQYKLESGQAVQEGHLNLDDPAEQDKLKVLYASAKPAGNLRLDTLRYSIGQERNVEGLNAFYKNGTAYPQGALGLATDTALMNRPGLIKGGAYLFSNAADARLFEMEHGYGPKNTIIQESASQELRILPANESQHAGFVVYDLVRYGSFALLFLGLSRLFRNFSNREFFSESNVVLLRNIGCIILLPQLLYLFTWALFLSMFAPVKIRVGNELNSGPLAWYSFNPAVSWGLVLTGLGIYLLSIIFRDGLELQKKEKLTI